MRKTKSRIGLVKRMIERVLRIARQKKSMYLKTKNGKGCELRVVREKGMLNEGMRWIKLAVGPLFLVMSG